MRERREDRSVLVKRRKEGKISPTQMLQHFHFEPLFTGRSTQRSNSGSPMNWIWFLMTSSALIWTLTNLDLVWNSTMRVMSQLLLGGNGVQCVDEKATNVKLRHKYSNSVDGSSLTESIDSKKGYGSWKTRCVVGSWS